jgi:hypothetical protein
MNGTQIGSNINDPFNINPTIDLTIANEYRKSNIAAFGGYLYYLSILKGEGLYTTNFDSTSKNIFPTNTTILINKDYIPPQPQIQPPTILRMSLYTNNSQVYYKPNSLSSGIGSVRNHRAKKYRT